MNKQTLVMKSLTPEERSLLCFSQPVGYDVRLRQYREYPEHFAKRTCQPQTAISLSMTKTFRHYLRRFIRTFRPERLLPNKNLWLQLENNGRFCVRLGKNGREVTCLSETDKAVFQYLCFLHLCRFWDSVRKRCRFPATRLPVTIRDFSDRLDESVNYDALLRRALAVSDRIIVL